MYQWLLQRSKKEKLNSSETLILRKSWTYISDNVGSMQFSQMFFTIFKDLDPDVYRLLSPHQNSRAVGNTKATLLIYIIQILLQIKQFDYVTKKKFRSLGRRHILSGITREHFVVFASVLASCMGMQRIPMIHVEDVVKAWSNLLYRVIDEMFSEQIHLADHDGTTRTIIDESSTVVVVVSRQTKQDTTPTDAVAY